MVSYEALTLVSILFGYLAFTLYFLVRASGTKNRH